MTIYRRCSYILWTEIGSAKIDQPIAGQIVPSPSLTRPPPPLVHFLLLASHIALMTQNHKHKYKNSQVCHKKNQKVVLHFELSHLIIILLHIEQWSQVVCNFNKVTFTDECRHIVCWSAFPPSCVLLQTILFLYRNQTMITNKLLAKVDQGLAPRDHKLVPKTCKHSNHQHSQHFYRHTKKEPGWMKWENQLKVWNMRWTSGLTTRNNTPLSST